MPYLLSKETVPGGSALKKASCTSYHPSIVPLLPYFLRLSETSILLERSTSPTDHTLYVSMPGQHEVPCAQEPCLHCQNMHTA